jgi:cardiolipin synthase
MFVESYLKDLRRRHYSPGGVAEYVGRCARLSLAAAWERPTAMAWVVMAGLGHLVFLFGLSVLLSFLVDRSLAVDYFVASAWWLLGGLTWITLHLRMYRKDHDLPMSGLGLPNFITLGRLLTIPAFYIFMTRGHHLLALTAFLLGGISDVADGIVARRLNASSRMGRILDPLVDILFNCGVVLALNRAGILPGWILVLVFIRYGLLMFGATWIYVVKGPVAIRPTPLGKTTGVVNTGLVFGLIVLSFLPTETSDRILDLLYSTFGFVLILTIVQVLIIGFYNMRHAGHVPQAHGTLGVVVGRVEAEGGEPPLPSREGPSS